MTGIVSYGAYIPRYRIDRKVIFKAMGWLNPASAAYARGEKAVASYDEDSLTMATAACMDCLTGLPTSVVDGLYFASTTMPYKERLNAGIIATALNLAEETRSADFCSGLKCGTTALICAIEAIESGRAKNILISAADDRLGKMGTAEEMMFGDAAAAFLVGNDDVIAEFKGSFSLSLDFVDHYRGAMSKYGRSWEERWIRDEGVDKFIPAAITGLLEKFDLNLSDFAKVIYSCRYPAAHKKIARKLGLDPKNIQETMMNQIGDTGSPHPLLMFIKALEDARPGEKILVVSFGSGCDALMFEVTDRISELNENKGLKTRLDRKCELTSYEKYVVFKGLGQADLGLRAEEDIWTRWSFLWRNRKTILGLVGSRCKVCGTPQYPPQRVCVNPGCGAIDKMEEYPFANKRGRIFNYTGDMLAASFDPPAIHGQIDFEGGGRYWFDFTDCSLGELKVGMPVRMSFRKRYYDDRRDIHGYFWKAMPKKEDE
ncbi:MAG: OB-fold domain-containing protein [Deltaproteobacteria bacterium]|nr:OB-fold domain-containing protein [Deltaproteobacteria bacterium]